MNQPTKLQVDADMGKWLQATRPGALRTDSEILEWLEAMHTLHTKVVALYCVAYYEVSLCYDDEPMHQFEGDTLRDAYSAAMVMTYENRRFVRKEATP